MTRLNLRHTTMLIAALLSAAPAPFAALAAQPGKHHGPGPARPLPGGWNATVTLTPMGSHVLGNPAAKVKLVEYVSYTCPHCAHFNEESAAGLQIQFVNSGQGSVEVRNLLRDPADLAVALITNCAPVRRFFAVHQAFMHTQAQWLDRAAHLSPEQGKRWYNGPQAGRMRAIAGDLHLYEIAQTQGLDHAMVDRCLGDGVMEKRLTDMTVAADKAGVASTPSFAIDGLLLAGTHDWKTLEPQLAARM